MGRVSGILRFELHVQYPARTAANTTCNVALERPSLGSGQRMTIDNLFSGR